MNTASHVDTASLRGHRTSHVYRPPPQRLWLELHPPEESLLPHQRPTSLLIRELPASVYPALVLALAEPRDVGARRRTPCVLH